MSGIDSPALRARIERVLRYIDANLNQPLSVPELAAHSGWSRWQFQRVFAACTGLSVAQYVRELRLSRAADALLSTTDRQLDIALAHGFDSEISFSRSFKQLFGCTPGTYRRRQLRTGLRTPILAYDLPPPPSELQPRMPQIRIESRPAFEVLGLAADINGLYSSEPDFAEKVPALWQVFRYRLPRRIAGPLLAVLDTSQAVDSGSRFSYWAAIEAGLTDPLPTLERLTVPEQLYAVIPHQGPLCLLKKRLEWFLEHWLAAAGYRGVYGYDLEVYPQGFDSNNPSARMEYWVPIEPAADLGSTA